MFQWQSYCSLIVTSFSEKHQENKPEPSENSERFSKFRSSSPDSGIVKEEIIDYDDSVEPAPTEYEKAKH